MRLRNSVLQVPTILGFLGERDELLSGGCGEDPKVFVLGAIFEFYCRRGLGAVQERSSVVHTRSFPGRNVCSTGGKVELCDVGKGEFL